MKQILENQNICIIGVACTIQLDKKQIHKSRLSKIKINMNQGNAMPY